MLSQDWNYKKWRACWTSPECDFASWAAKYRKLFLSWVLVSNMKVFSPRKLGKMNHFDDHIFQRGWFNHRRSLAYIIFPCIFWAEASFLDDRLGVWTYQFGEPATFSRNSYHLTFFKCYLSSFNHLQMNWYMKYLDHLQYQLLLIIHTWIICRKPTPWLTHAGLNSIPSTENPWIRRYLGSVGCRPRQRSLGFLGTACSVHFVGFRNLVREFLEAGYLFCFYQKRFSK